MSNFKNLTPFMPSFSSKRVLEVTSASATQSNYDADLKELGVAQHSKVASNQIASHTQKYDFVIFNLDVSALGDEEFLALAEAALSRLEPDGSLFFSASVNGEKSRSAITYIDLAQMKAEQENGTQYGFELAFAKPFSSDPNSPSLYNNVAYLLKKQKVENYHGYKSLKEFMDHKQYSRNGVIRYEVIFGAGFVSTGGIDTTTEFLKELNLKPGQKVLDVGCGIGGGDFLMAEKYGVDVLGIDLASNMIGIAWERAPQHKNLNVRFEIGDVTKQIFPDDYFDLIYSRDTILHIKDKESLFAQFKKWLKPGGRVFITDYCAGPRDKWSSEFAAYVEQRGYDLRTVDQYGAIFTSLGFANVRALDRTDLFVQSLKNELTKMAEIKEKFVSDFSLDDFNYLVDGWNAKLVRCADGNQVWGYFYCEK